MATAKPKALKIPKNLAQVADMLYDVRQRRLAMQKEVDLLAADEAQLREHLINNLPKSEASGIAGKVARAAIEMKEVVEFKAENWPKLYAYIAAEYAAHLKKKDGMQDSAFALLQRRISDGTAKELLEAKVKLPGMKIGKVPTVSLTKIS